MKKILTILISIILVALIIFCAHSCIKKGETTEIPQEDKPGITENQPVSENPKNNEEQQNNDKEENPTFTEIGIFSGKIDNNSIELIVGNDMPLTLPYRLSPEVAENFSSYNLEINDMITFEYQEIDGQSVITNIIQ